jgi:osmotically-inducible protein OsmY
MPTETQLYRDVFEELNWDPSVHAADIGVATRDGVVTLHGAVSSFAERVAAERAALRVYGVKGIANDLEVRLPGLSERTDSDIAQAAVNAVEWNAWVPHDQITIAVHNGWLTLRGQVERHYQKIAAEEAVWNLLGVKGVTNEITVRPQVTGTDVAPQIAAAFRRSAQLDAPRIRVETHGGTVSLFGTVRSWLERQEAERVAWGAPGVCEVENHITVTPEVDLRLAPLEAASSTSSKPKAG